MSGNIDSLNMGRALWRNKKIVAPVLVLTLLGVLWALFLMPVTYQVQSSLLLLPPPPAPSDEQLDRHPSLVGLNSDNPYARRYDPTILIAIASKAVTSPPGREAIGKAGGDERFTVAQASTYGFGSPFADITSMGSSPEDARKSNDLIIASFRAKLEELQAAEKVSPLYFVTLRETSDPSTAQVNATATGKVALQLFVLGLFTLFAAVSIGDALREVRGRRSAPAAAAAPPVPPVQRASEQRPTSVTS